MGPLRADDDYYSFQRILASDDALFNAHFECGNLARASRVMLPPSGYRARGLVYELQLNFDLHSRGHIQWFFFSVRRAPVVPAAPPRVDDRRVAVGGV